MCVFYSLLFFFCFVFFGLCFLFVFSQYVGGLDMKQGRCLKPEYNNWLQNYELKLKSVMRSHENLVIQGILTNIMSTMTKDTKRGNYTINHRVTDKFAQNTIYKLIMWRKCQSFSQGNMHSSMVGRVRLESGKPRPNLNLKLLQKRNNLGNNNHNHTKNDKNDENKFVLLDRCYNEISKAFDHQNFVAFRRVTGEKHDKFSFDIIAMLLYNKFNYQHLRLFLKQLINFDVNIPNNFKILRSYGTLVIKYHFEKNFLKLLTKKAKLKIIDNLQQTLDDLEKKQNFTNVSGNNGLKKNKHNKTGADKRRTKRKGKTKNRKQSEDAIMDSIISRNSNNYESYGIISKVNKNNSDKYGINTGRKQNLQHVYGINKKINANRMNNVNGMHNSAYYQLNVVKKQWDTVIGCLIFDSGSNSIKTNGNSVNDTGDTGDIKCLSWIFACAFIIESLLLTDDGLWQKTLEHMANITDNVTLFLENNEINMFGIRKENVKGINQLIDVLNDLWQILKGTKYIKLGNSFNQLGICLKRQMMNGNA